MLSKKEQTCTDAQLHFKAVGVNHNRLLITRIQSQAVCALSVYPTGNSGKNGPNQSCRPVHTKNVNLPAFLQRCLDRLTGVLAHRNCLGNTFYVCLLHDSTHDVKLHHSSAERALPSLLKGSMQDVTCKLHAG